MPALTILITLAVSLAVASDAPAPTPDGTGEIFVRSEPPGGTIILDGQPTDVIAPGVLVDVPSGQHTVQVSQACAAGQATVTVRPGMIERVELTLKPQDGALTILYEPAGAVVAVDRVPLGATPLEEVIVPCGEHQLQLTAPGRVSLTQLFEVKGGQTTVLEGTLGVVERGSLAVRVVPAGAEVLVDGLLVGAAPLEVAELEAGSHRITARATGFEEREQTVEVVAGGQQDLSLELAPILPEPSARQKLGLDRIRWGALALDVGLAGAAVGLGALSYSKLRQSDDGYAHYLELTYAEEPELFYQEEVLTPRRHARVMAVSAGASALLSAAGFVFVPVVAERTGDEP